MLTLPFMNPCPETLSEKSSLNLVLPSTMTINWRNHTKAHYQWAYLPQSLYYQASGGSSFFPSSLLYYYNLHRLTCTLLPPWPPAFSADLLCKGVHRLSYPLQIYSYNDVHATPSRWSR